MALTGTSRGQGSHNTSAASFALSPASNFSALSMAVLVVAYDNSGTNGADPLSSVTDSHGNSWTVRQSALFDPGATNAGCTLAIVTSAQEAGTLTTGSTITVSFTNNTTAKAWALHEAAGAAGFAVQYVTGNKNTGATTATPTVTTTSIASGNMVIGGGASESSNTWAADTDVTNGSWSTQQSAGAGSGATGMAVTTQRKVVTASATQTYNPRLTSADCILAWIELTEAFALGDPWGRLGFYGT